MKANNINSRIVFFKKLPKKYLGENIENKTEAELIALGFKNVVYPELTVSQRYGFLKEYEDRFEYDVVDIPEPTAEEIQYIKKQERNKKLTDGIIVNNIWFNEDKLTQFTVMAQMFQAMGQTSFEWGFEDGFAPITVQDAFNTVMQASTQFQQIYKDYA